jgi:hypothetical protein
MQKENFDGEGGVGMTLYPKKNAQGLMKLSL